MTVFSVLALSQLQLRADCLPQEHLAWEAQAQASLERPQQVLGTVMAFWETVLVSLVEMKVLIMFLKESVFVAVLYSVLRVVAN